MSELTQKRLKEVINYDPETGSLTWTEARGRVKAGYTAGYVNSRGYVYVRIDKTMHFGHRLAWLYTTGDFPKEEIDHINHIRSDNRLVNLREITHQGNQKNRTINSNSKSGVLGVTWHKREEKWQALIRIDGAQKFLGYFIKIADAAKARAKADIKYGFHLNHGQPKPENGRK